MNEPVTGLIEKPTHFRLDAAFNTAQNALKKAAPVIRTAAGGALAVGSAMVMKDFIIPHWNQFNDVPANAVMLKGLLTSIGAQSTALGMGGVAMMRKPVGEAVNFFRTQISQRLAK